MFLFDAHNCILSEHFPHEWLSTFRHFEPNHFGHIVEIFHIYLIMACCQRFLNIFHVSPLEDMWLPEN